MGELRELPKVETPEKAARFLEWTREIALKRRPNMVGFVVLAWDKDGTVTICGDMTGNENPIPKYLLPAWVAEHVRGEFVTCSEVRGVLRDEGFLAPPDDSVS